MKRFSKLATQGVTLLEIMLVLAIAAMIIVMSVRYYQSASQNQQANAFIEQVQGIAATVESYAQGAGGYTNASQAAITPLLPNNAFVAPWGGTMSLTATTTGFSLAINPGCSPAVGSLVQVRLQSDKRFTVSATCTSVAYNATT